MIKSLQILFKWTLGFMPFVVSAQSYIIQYGGLTVQGVGKVQQTGTAHKIGKFNEFDTDFNLHVKLNGKSKTSVGYIYGFTFGTEWRISESKFKHALELDLFYTSASHESTLSNPNTEEVRILAGSNAQSVQTLVEEHYGAGHHTFSNSMTMNRWNVAPNLMLSYDLSPKISIYYSLGFGYASVKLRNAKSYQSSPAPAVPGYEITQDHGGGIVNHFNSQPNASNDLMFGQFGLGAKIQLVNIVSLQLDARLISMGKGTFVFGSTQYSDHAPTDQWTYTMDQSSTYTFSVGAHINLNPNQ